MSMSAACVGGGWASAADLYPSGAAAYVVEVDGNRRWSFAPDRELPPASLTKLMTALLVAEAVPALTGTATASTRVAAATGTRLGLRTGDRLAVRDLVAAALIESANDACLALAEHVAGDEAAFVRRMNERAIELGLRHTQFANACGHDAPGHYSSAADLATLARAALAVPALAVLVATRHQTISSAGGRQWELVNGNALLGRYDGAIGIKTGYTQRAGKCVIALARRDGVSVLVVVLDAPNRWWETHAALDAAFAAASRERAGR